MNELYSRNSEFRATGHDFCLALKIFVELVIEWSEGIEIVNDDPLEKNGSQAILVPQEDPQEDVTVHNDKVLETERSRDRLKRERDVTVLTNDNAQDESDSEAEPCQKKARDQVNDHDGYSIPLKHHETEMQTYSEPHPTAYWNVPAMQMATEPTTMIAPTATSSEELPGNREKPEWDGAPTDDEWEAALERVSLCYF